MQSGFSTRSISTSGHSAASSSSSLTLPVSENTGHDSSIAHRPVTPIGQRPHRYSVASSQPSEIPQYQPSYEPSPPPRSLYHTPPRHAPRYSMPAASSGFIPVSSTVGSALHSARTLVSYGSEPGLAPPPAHASNVPGYAPAPTPTPAPVSFTPGPAVSPGSTSPGSYLSTASLPQQPQPLNVPHAGYSPPVSAPPSSHLPAPPLQMFPTPSQSAPPQVYPGHVQPVSAQPHEYISTSAPVPQATGRVRVVSNHIPGSRPLPPQPQQAMQRVPPSASMTANHAYNQAIGALTLPYAQNQVRPPATDSGLPPAQQNPLPVPPGPPGPLGPGSHTPSNSTNAIVPASSFHLTPSPSPQPSPSQQSSGLHMPEGMAHTNGSLPPSPVPPQTGHPRSISGRPSLPLPPPPPLSATGSYQQMPFPQLPIPPAPVPSSQSQQQYLNSSPSSAMQAGQPFHPGPPPRPPSQITDSLQLTSYRQVAH